MKKLYGITCAMITPFADDMSVDIDAIEQYTGFLIDKGIDCLYPLGTTGEMYKMTRKERMTVAETVVKAAAGRVPVFIHTGAHDPDEVIELSKHACDIGADGVGIITPSFFSLRREEAVDYYRNICCRLPSDFSVYLYHLPQCTSQSFDSAIASEIAECCPNVVGIKYSYPDMIETLRFLGIRGGEFSVLQGADRLTAACLAMGCEGIISGCASAYPEPFIRLKKQCGSGDINKVKKLQQSANEIADILRGGASAAWFKAALEWRGIIKSRVRPPQKDINEEERAMLFDALSAYNTKNDIKRK